MRNRGTSHPYNIQRRLLRRDLTIANNNTELSCLKDKLEEMTKLNAKLKKINHNLQEKIRYNRDKPVTDLNQMKQELKMVKKQNSDLKKELEDVMSTTNNICLYENQRYTDATRLVVYELLSKGVSSANVGSVIESVLRHLANLDVDRVPQATIVKHMSAEAALLAKVSAARQIATSSSTSTLHTDGTTKKHRKYLDFLATTTEGSVS